MFILGLFQGAAKPTNRDSLDQLSGVCFFNFVTGVTKLKKAVQLDAEILRVWKGVVFNLEVLDTPVVYVRLGSLIPTFCSIFIILLFLYNIRIYVQISL